jgi:hypothetical protein
MAKALFGHVGTQTDIRMLAQMRRLQERVRELEGEVSRLRAMNDSLSAAADVELHPDLLELSRTKEPMLT